jgi:glycine cleavage system H protein
MRTRWVRAEGKRATIGITDFAQKQMGDIARYRSPRSGYEVDADSELSGGRIHGDLSFVSPITGTVVEVNDSGFALHHQ